MKYHVVSHKGLKRNNNEDYYYANKEKNIYIIADGMGGHKAGDVASRLAVKIISESLEQKDLLSNHETIKNIFYESIEKANSIIYDKSLKSKECNGMGTTIVIVLIVDDMCYISHVGDSRAYCCDDKEIRQITSDHSLVNELIQSGNLSREAAKEHPKKNVITRAVGTEPTIQFDFIHFNCTGVEKILLCTDGLTDLVDEKKIEEICIDNTVEDACLKLLNLANENGGLDNITIMIINTDKDVK